MTPARYRRVALLGTGHIGGSLLLALRAGEGAAHSVGYDVDPARARRALERGIVDGLAASAAEAVRGADLVVLATPVGALAEVAAAIAGSVAVDALVVDVGSTKASVVAAVERALPAPERFVGCHPIAGTERSGPDAADADLFRGRVVLLTPTARTLPEAVAAATALWEAAGARVERIEPGFHDAVLACVSHLPHAAAFALAAAVERALEPDPALAAAAAGLAGAGFADTTRIAASDPTMWRDVFVANRAALLPLVEGLIAELATLREALAGGDGAALVALVERARRGRARVLGPRPQAGAQSAADNQGPRR